NLNQDKATKPQTVQIVRQGEVTPYWFKVNPLYWWTGKRRRSKETQCRAAFFVKHYDTSFAKKFLTRDGKGRLKLPFRRPYMLFYTPAAAFNAAALSVRSQVNSGSSRPKWP
ncbi:MAG: hypothetical protein E6899_10150, partial [Neisseria sp.]|nr:hypothetical protein [Neisseria sp.]